MKMNIVKPSIYDDFVCVGKECIFTCCGGWGIPIEEEVWRKCREYEEKIEYDSKLNIYKLKMDSRDLCPFLDEFQLCTLVLKKKDLCTTCREFPRVCMISLNKEKSLMLDCPQVVALLEKLEGPLTFLTESVEEIGCMEEEHTELIKGNETMKLIHNIRVRMIVWMQKRELPLWYRIFFSAFCLKKMGEMVEWNEMEEKMEKMMSKQYYEKILAGIDHIVCDRHKQFEEIRSIIIQLNGFLLLPLMDDKSGSRSKAIRLMAKNQDCNFEEYAELYDKWETGKKAEFDVLLENIVVYQWFQYTSPGNCITFMHNNFLAIILEFLLVRHFSILSYAIWGEDGIELQFLVALAARTMRIRKDNNDYKEWLGEMEKDILSTANLYCLLK